MTRWWNAFLDRWLGKRHRKGWPRGVRPVAPWIDDLRVADPELWETYRQAPVAEFIRRFAERNPTHWIAEKTRDPQSWFFLHPREAAE